LPADVLQYGSVDNFSAFPIFPYETFLNRLKKYMKSGKYPLSELANRIIEDRKNSLSTSSSKITTPILKQPHQDGII